MAEQLKLPEVARRLGVSEKTARRYIKSGTLPSLFIGGAYRVEEEDLEAFLQGARVSPPDGNSLKGSALPSPQQSFNGWLEEEQRAQQLSGWKRYLSRRVEWCESVLQKSPDNDFNNPFLSLDTAIQWAIYVGIEKAQLHDAIRTEVWSYTDENPEIVDDLNALLDRFVAIDHQTNVKVKAMMDEAELDEEDKEQVRLRLIDGSAA